MREHLQAWERTTGKRHPMLAAAPKCPRGCEALWSDFARLSATRSWADGLPARIGFGEIEAYQRINGFRFEPWELDALQRADGAFLTAQAERRKAAKA